MKTMLGSRLFLLFSLSCPAWTQVSAPFLGYFADGNRIRPANGIAASASVDAAIEAGDFALVQTVPGQHYLLTVASGTGQVALLKPGIGATPLVGAGYAPDTIFPSPGGAAAALWFASSKQIQVAARLTGEAQVRHIAFVPENPSALAISDDGSWLAGLWSGKLHLFGPRGETTQVELPAPATAIAFQSGSHDLALATAQGIARLSSLETHPELTPLHVLEDAVSIAFTGDNRTLAALTASGAVWAIRTNDGSAIRAECACGADRLLRLTGSTFRVSGLKQNSFLLFDANTGDILVAPLAASAGRNAEE